MVQEVRHRQPRIGTRKLYYLLRTELQSLPHKMGRDGLFTLLRDNGLLIHRKRRTCYTTNAAHGLRIYPNLLQDIEITAPDQVYASDITYVRSREGFYYLSLLSDLYSRKILGYYLSNDLSAYGPLTVLRRCLRNLQLRTDIHLIHHSDRGIQYCSRSYIRLLQQKGVLISMSKAGNPYDNAIMERIIGILKEEFLLNVTFNDKGEALRSIKDAVTIYNEERPHLSLHYKTPENVYKQRSKNQAA